MSAADLDALKVEFSERSRPIVFWTGAGLSVPAIPSWSGLRDYLLEQMKERAKSLSPQDQRTQLAEHSQIKAVADMWLQFDRIEKNLGRETYVQRIKERLSISEKIPVPDAHTKIWELAPTGVVTLNLDLFTQRASATHPKQAIPIPVYPGKFTEHLNILRERRPFIAYPHGHLDNPNLWTFTKSDLERRLSDSKYLEWLTILLRASTVIFIGITADDIAIGSPIEKITSHRIPLTGHYWITPRDDIHASDWAGRHGVNIIRYENKKGDHAELLNLLDSLKATIRQEDPQKETPVFPKTTRTVSANFPTPEELDKVPDEEKRQLLNAKAKVILSNKDEITREREYSDFLQKYGRSVFGAWYASTTPGENEFLGYRLLSEVDGGAFGTVYKGTDSNGEAIALKLLKSENFRKLGFHRSFRRGANSLRILTERDIPGIVKYIDAAEIPPTIVMSWSDGQSLHQLVESGQIEDWSERIEISLQLASILRTCHALPERVLHRDLRPANVMVENCYDHIGEWQVRVLDFDLSWHKGAEDHSIMHSPAFGYLAPEQRSKGKFTTRSALVDSYGFGMSLFFMCSRKNPFPDQHLHVNWSADLFRIFEGKRCPEWLSVPRRIARLVFNVTQGEQSARATMSQIEGELESLKCALDESKDIPLIDVITEELAIRTEHFHGYAWSDTDSRAHVSSANGLSLTLESTQSQRTIKFLATWSSSGAQDWSHIDRMLSQAVPKIQESLKKLWENVLVSKGRREFSISATIEADEARKNILATAKELDKAIQHASSIANF